MTAALSCNNLSKSLGGRTVLDGLSIDIAAGEVVSLLGASGSGKTTLLRLVAGLLHPDSGSIRLNGGEIFGPGIMVPPERRKIGMVFQDYALWPHMTVAGNLRFGLESQKLARGDIDQRVAHALEVSQLGPFRDRYPSELSGGQQQRVAIARCLAARPALMLFDEPLSNLDAALREDMRVEMMRLARSEGSTVLYVTHDQGEAMAVSDRIAVMRAGVVAQLDTPQRIYDAPADPLVAAFIGGFSLLSGRCENGWFRPAGSMAEPLQTAGRMTGDGVLVVRPEDARPAAAGTGNRLQGIVSSRAFQGRCWRLSVDIGDQRLRVDWPEGLGVGAVLEFSLPPDRCLVLPAQ